MDGKKTTHIVLIFSLSLSSIGGVGITWLSKQSISLRDRGFGDDVAASAQRASSGEINAGDGPSDRSSFEWSPRSNGRVRRKQQAFKAGANELAVLAAFSCAFWGTMRHGATTGLKETRGVSYWGSNSNPEAQELVKSARGGVYLPHRKPTNTPRRHQPRRRCPPQNTRDDLVAEVSWYENCCNTIGHLPAMRTTARYHAGDSFHGSSRI
ncbi:hypothetical protein HPP92_001339 [Vanilla planifolia]|uniref:Uncharacterized protein n=1 Tax=Vanilla planifolia TaxID=51239 RepID=A0A835SBS4_VANPL|nr:hypothetical protein HPP92_001339 [Vanilla planifolia]